MVQGAFDGSDGFEGHQRSGVPFTHPRLEFGCQQAVGVERLAPQRAVDAAFGDVLWLVHESMMPGTRWCDVVMLRQRIGTETANSGPAKCERNTEALAAATLRQRLRCPRTALAGHRAYAQGSCELVRARPRVTAALSEERAGGTGCLDTAVIDQS